MNRWTGSAIRHLRQRLGWSQAELSRRLGCELDMIARWEAEDSLPQQDVSEHLDFLLRHLESRNDSIARSPVAEALMNHWNLSQIHNDQIEINLETDNRVFLLRRE